MKFSPYVPLKKPESSSSTPDSGGGKSSKFNAGLMQMARIHELQERINLCNVNLLSWNPEADSFHYQIKIADLGSLFTEMEAKLSVTERKDGERVREVILRLITRYPIHKKLQNQVTNKSFLKFSKRNWKVVNEELTKFEILIKGFLDSRGMNSPIKGEQDLF